MILHHTPFTLRAAMLMLTVAALGWGQAKALPFKPSPVPGGVAVVAVQGGDGKLQPPKVRFRGEPVLVRKTTKGWQAVVGIPLGAKPGKQSLEVDGKTVPFTIRPKRYPLQRLFIENERMVTPNAEDEARIAKERVLISAAWKVWPQGLVPSLSLIQPTPGVLTSSFGLRRVFNGKPRSPHTGLDIRAPQGQVVTAPADGVVVLVGDFFYSGNAVFLAHGEGVVSLFAHLSKINVTEGQRLKVGEPLGEVGSTGRSTGPHLHWALSLNDALVDPRIFL